MNASLCGVLCFVRVCASEHDAHALPRWWTLSSDQIVGMLSCVLVCIHTRALSLFSLSFSLSLSLAPSFPRCTLLTSCGGAKQASAMSHAHLITTPTVALSSVDDPVCSIDGARLVLAKGGSTHLKHVGHKHSVHHPVLIVSPQYLNWKSNECCV